MLEERTGRSPLTNRTGRESIPEEELRDLALVVADARDYAARGRMSLGYALLLRGLMRAERCLQDERPWAMPLLLLWREIIDRFCDEYDVVPSK